MPTALKHSAFLFVLVAASAVFAAADEAVMFSEWLSAQKSGKARAADYGAEAETVHACLRVISFESCQSFDRCVCPSRNLAYVETKLGCCHNHGYGYDQPQKFFKDVEQAHVGSCWWDLSLFNFGPGESTTDLVVGTFDVTCELKAEAEKCGEVFCDDMIFRAWGRMYDVGNVAIEGQPSVQVERPCFIFGRRYGVGERKEAAQTPAVEAPAAKNVAKAGVQNTKDYHPKVEYFLGEALMLSGSVNVYSCSHDLKVQEGRLQVALAYARLPVPIEPSPGQLIVRPYEINMKLKKAGSY